LVIINDCFPFDKAEPFLETELNYYKEFNRVVIIPCSVQGYSQTRNINYENIRLVKVEEKNGFGLKRRKVLGAAKALFNPVVIQELRRLKSINKINLHTIKNLLSFVSIGEKHFKRIDQWLKANGFKASDEIIFYSYWMHFHSYIAIKLKNMYPNSRAISRCHRFDLYEYRNDYIPLRPYILESLDVIFSISQDGKRYLEKKYPDTAKDIQISRLGSSDHGIKNVNLARKPLKIVSCSWVSSVKRVERIIAALIKLENIDVNWVHFGDGDSFKNLKSMAQQKLKNNIQYELKGAISNKDLLETYKTQDFHVFVNVSESEGVPVSIMEAMSFGIPVVATDVGGVNEIVVDGYNGYLLEKDFMDLDLVANFMKIYNLSEPAYSKLRENAREFWEKNYNADSNYRKFVSDILSLN
jgi:colanic acid/amylovoran biosynthesis glycosyltransferase